MVAPGISKNLSATEGKYSAFDQELLAAFTAIRHFRYALEGCQFQLCTDHKLLLAALHRVSEPWTPRQQWQLSFIAECTGDVIHVPGVSKWWRTRFHNPQPPLCAT